MSMYDGILEIGSDGQIIEPVLVLSSRGGNKMGVIRNVTGIHQTHPLSEVAELSFDVHKEMNGEVYDDWDKLKDFRFVQIPRTNDWFEATISLDEEDETVKHVTCMHANEAELGQLNLYEVEINTEADINRDDYKVTTFYNEDDTRASLLHRILRDKAPHYQIYHVDETLVKLFRQFSFNGVSIQDAFNQVAQECNCLFVYGEWYENDGKYHRTISVYDLEDYCVDCGKRGNYTSGHCTNCGSDNIIYGYGEDTGIFISRENLANSIEYQTNTDEVKNCFRLSGGDDVMTAAIKSCNPNKSSYIWYFSDDMLEDMSEELRDKLVEYTELVDTYSTATEIPVPEELVDKYNELVETYSEYNSGLVPIEYPISGTIKLSEAYYNATNLYGFLKSILAPTAEEVKTTTAQEQMAALKSEPRMSRVGIADASGTISKASANSAIQSYAKVFIDTSRYKVVVATNQITGNLWNGTITLKSYINDEDTASETFNITLFDGSNNAEYTEWVKQTIDKAMANREATDLSVIGLFDDDVSLSQFKERLELYSLDYLSMMNNMATSAITVMVEQGIADENSTNTDVYNQLYAPYYEKAKAIGDELFERETQLSYIFQATDENGNVNPDFPYLGLIDYIVKAQEEVATRLNIENVLGAELWEELSFYRREQEYQNPNFISDGLTDSEIIDYAQKFYDVAYKEIVKSSTLQHTISAPLINFLLMEEFKPLQAKFKAGNWIRLEVDGKLCKLRLVNWTVDYDNIEDLDVEFSDVIRMGDLISDTESILSKARSMSSSYGFIARQADMGYDASETLKDYKDRGLDFSKIKVIQSKGNTNIIYDDDGILLKKVNGVDTLPEQARIYNNGIYITRDAWETVSTGLGHFSYVDPETGETIKTYGIIADTVIGKLILGDNLGIYSPNSTLKMDDTGFTVTAKPNEDNSDLFTIRRDTGNVDGDNNKIYETYIHVDSNGNLVISGNSIVIGSKTVAEAIDDARKVASNYLSADDSGIMVANLANGVVNPSDMQNGKNVLITSNDVKIRDGQRQLASYGDTITIGKTATGERNVYIDSNGVNIREGTDKISQFGSNIVIGKQGVGQKNISIDSNGIELNDNTNSIASFGNDIRIGEENNNNILLTNDSFSGTKYLKVNDEYKNIEVFNMVTGGGVVVEESPVILKESGDTVTSSYTCIGTPDDPSTIYIYLEITLVSGQNKYTPIWSREYDTNDQRSLTRGSSIGWTVYRGGYSYIQRLQTTFTYTVSSKEITFTVKDTGNDADNQIESVKMVIRYLNTETSYPHYRFGVYDGYNSVDDVPYVAGNFAFDIGENNIPSGNYSFVHGIENGVQGFGSSASGGYCNVSGDYSSANGNGCSVSGTCSSTVGLNNTVRGDYSFVSGVGNIARYEGQTVIGKYAPATASDDVLMVGTGTAIDNKAYAMRLKNDGRVEFKGAVGTGLVWNSRSEMVTKVGALSLNVPYNFFATSTEGNNGTIFWSITAGAEDGANAFGTICKMTTNTWQMYFMCSGKFYISIFDVNSNTFNTTKLT